MFNRRQFVRRHEPKIGLWLYPGGHVDADEDPAQAAVREVAEETGINAVVIGELAFTHSAVASHPAPWAIIEMDVSDSKVGAHRHVDFVYVLAATGGELTVQLEEVGGTRWVPLADVACLPTPSELPAWSTPPRGGPRPASRLTGPP